MKAIYAFSGDPITYGHIDIIERAAATYDRVTVAIGANPAKTRGYLFTPEERLKMAKRSTAHLDNVDCVIFEGLLAQYAYRNGYNVIIRGVRNSGDLEAELTLYSVNQLQFATIDTVFFPAKPTLAHVSSSVVRALVSEGGDVSEYVPIYVKQKLEQKISRQIRIGVTGGIGSGKSFVAQSLVKHIPNSRHIDLDEIGHYILSNSPEPAYQETRSNIARDFGKDILEEDGSINRRILGNIVFQDARKLTKLNRIMLKPILARLYEMCRDNHGQDPSEKPDVVILETGLFVESRLTHLVNHCMVLVTSPEEVRVERLAESRDMSEDEAHRRIRREITDDERRSYLNKMLKYNDSSFLLEFENGEKAVPGRFAKDVQQYIERLARS